MGIPSVEALRRADPKSPRREFSATMERTILELNGVSCLHLEEVAPRKKQIISSKTFGRPFAEGLRLLCDF